MKRPTTVEQIRAIHHAHGEGNVPGICVAERSAMNDARDLAHARAVVRELFDFLDGNEVEGPSLSHGREAEIRGLLMLWETS